MKKMFLFAACLAVLACSCSENEEGTVKDVRASLKINANIGAPAVSRAEKTAREAGDKAGSLCLQRYFGHSVQPECRLYQHPFHLFSRRMDFGRDPAG